VGNNPGWLQRLWHTLRICRSAHMAATAIIVLAVVIGVLATFDESQPMTSQRHALFVLEMIVPLGVLAAFCHLLTIDHDSGFAEVLHSLPTSMCRITIERIIVATILISSFVAFIIELLHQYAGLDRCLAWQAFALPALFLFGLTQTASVVGGNWITGLGAGSVYMLVDALTNGQISGAFFLYQVSRGTGTVPLVTNRCMLASAGLGLLVLAVVCYSRQRRSNLGLQRR